MVARIWDLEIDPSRAAEFEVFASGVALPMVRGKMGCSAVYVLRDGSSAGRYTCVTLWLSRKAMLVAAASVDWDAVVQAFAAFGVAFDLDRARAFDAIASFRAGEKS